MAFSMKIALFILIIIGSTQASPDKPEIQTTSGTVRGQTLNCGNSCKYFGFRGIPYAKPPLGNLRFRAPVPHPGWSGVRDALEHGKNCPSDIVLGGINFGEDCLTLNVYTKSLTRKQAVMMWIHGGGFSMGSGNDLLHGPDYFVNEGVIIVTINYRLGSLGFLATNDNNATGNYGLKDSVLALKWIRDNIERFGGDPDRVTIFGESAGGVFVHYLVLSPSARGLFARAISQSGSAICPWAFQSDPEEATHRLARKLGLRWRDNADLMQQLRRTKYIDLIMATPGFMDLSVPRGLITFDFSPSLDPPETSAAEVFLPEKPLHMMLTGNFTRVPYITGFNSDESLFMVREYVIDSNVFNTLNNNAHLLVPRWWDISRRSRESDEVIEQVRRFYFKGGKLSYQLRYEYSQYNTDLMFAHGITQTARYHAAAQQEPIYLYRFSYDGPMNLLKTALMIKNYPGAMHAEELMYMFKVAKIEPAAVGIGKSAYDTRRRMVRMWTNFAKYGDPTPRTDSIVTTKWNPVNGRQQYLRIDTELSTGEFPSKDRMDFWTRLESKYSRQERLLWICMVIGGFVASNLLVETFWLRYKSNPTRLSVVTKHEPITRLVLPGITICPVDRIDSQRAGHFISRLTLPPNITNETIRKYLSQSNGFLDNVAYQPDNLQIVQDILDANHIPTDQAMSSINHACETLLFKCRWKFKITQCNRLFTTSSSQRGTCCTFNTKSSSEWTPYFTREAGLTIAVNPQLAIGRVSSTFSEGVKVLIHERDVFPSDCLEKMVPHRFETMIKITSVSIECSQEVRSLSTNERECLYFNEKRLRFFNYYKENSCDVECRMIKVLKLCECLPYYFKNEDGIPICNFTKIPCLVDNYFKIHENGQNPPPYCICPSNCNKVSYDARLHKVPFIVSNITLDPFYDGLNTSHLILHVLFGPQVFTKMRRDLLTSIISLAASLGGIYSLFIGMSVITFFELVYFATIRLRANYMEIKQKKIISEQLAKRRAVNHVRKVRIKI